MTELADDILCVSTRDLEVSLFVAQNQRAWSVVDERTGYRVLDSLFRNSLVWLPRTSDLEADERWVQVVAYVLLKHQDLWAVWRRTSLAGESRLQNQTTLGLGGHVERRDQREGGIWSTLWAAAVRELGEEVEFGDGRAGSISTRESRCLGVIYDPAEEVSARHLGIVFLVESVTGNLKVLDPGLEHLAWSNRKTLEDQGLAYDLGVETWSRILLREFILSQPESA